MIATLGIQSNSHIVQNGGVQRPYRLQDVHNCCTRHGGEHQSPLLLTVTTAHVAVLLNMVHLPRRPYLLSGLRLGAAARR
jgi:hypothetical protein